MSNSDTRCSTCGHPAHQHNTQSTVGCWHVDHDALGVPVVCNCFRTRAEVMLQIKHGRDVDELVASFKTGRR